MGKNRMNQHTPVSEDIQPVQLAAAADELLAEARVSGTAGRAARTLFHGSGLRATAIALCAGHELAEHASPPAALLLVQQGSVLLRGGGRQWQLDAGQIIPIPPERHSLLAETDAVVLLTVRPD
jgi:quercetin dioxygenase-like cupin family protein